MSATKENEMTVLEAVELAADADEVVVEAIHLLARFVREGNPPKIEQLVGVARDMLEVHKKIKEYIRQQERRQAVPKSKQENLDWCLLDAVPRG